MVKSGNKPKRGGALAASPSHLIHRALQLALDIYAEETGPDGLTQRQFAVLEAVSHKAGLTQTDLVRATGIDRSTLADLVARMTTKGLLDREKSAIDARAKAVRLSAAGETALEAARPRVERSMPVARTRSVWVRPALWLTASSTANWRWVRPSGPVSSA